MNPTALIAEDEPLLAENLRAELARAWPELQIVASVGHGAAAVEHALALRPSVLFLDIRMPGLSGLDAAQALAEEWPGDANEPLPLMVFVTAYDQYAVAAFERAAVDYLLKPVQPQRLAQTCERLQAALRQRAAPLAADDTLARLRDLLAAPSTAPPAPPRLTVITASAGATVRLIPVDDVIYFEAADKYVRVITAEGEHLIRTPLRDLLPQLDAARFWQVHRGTVVRCDAIASAVREESGKVTLTLHGRRDVLVASRPYAHRFKPL